MIATLREFVRHNFFWGVATAIFIGWIGRFYFLIRFHETFVTKWLLRQYYVNYVEYGFAKRAFVGTIFHPLFSTVGRGELGGQILVIAYEIAVLAGIAFLLDKFVRQKIDKSHQIFALILAAFVLAPVGFMQYGEDIGRLDHLNLLLLLIATALAAKERYAIAGILFGMAVLTHEAALFYGAGPLIAILFANRARPKDFVVCLSLGAFGLIAVGLWGNLSTPELAILATRPGSDTSVWTRGAFTTPLGDFTPHEVILMLYYTLVPLYVLYTIVRHNGASMVKVFAPQLIGLCLYPLGYDYFRWAGLIFISVSLTLIMLAGRYAWSMPKYSKGMSLFLLLYLLPLGPIGSAHPLPFIELIIYNVGQLLG